MSGVTPPAQDATQVFGQKKLFRRPAQHGTPRQETPPARCQVLGRRTAGTGLLRRPTQGVRSWTPRRGPQLREPARGLCLVPCPQFRRLTGTRTTRSLPHQERHRLPYLDGGSRARNQAEFPAEHLMPRNRRRSRSRCGTGSPVKVAWRPP